MTTHPDDQSIIVLRAISGAGKSTYARQLAAGSSGRTGSRLEDYTAIVSADGLFTDEETGEYRFDAARLGVAHGECFRRAVEAVQRGSMVIVDNTNLTAVECAPYMLLAQAYGRRAKVITLQCDLETAVARATHGVPRERIELMHAALVTNELPLWWAHDVMRPYAPLSGGWSWTLA